MKSLNNQAIYGMNGASAIGGSMIKNAGSSLGSPLSFGAGVLADFIQSQSGIQTSHFIACPAGSCEAYLMINNGNEAYRVH